VEPSYSLVPVPLAPLKADAVNVRCTPAGVAGIWVMLPVQTLPDAALLNDAVIGKPVVFAGLPGIASLVSWTLPMSDWRLAVDPASLAWLNSSAFLAQPAPRVTATIVALSASQFLVSCMDVFSNGFENV